MHGYNSWHAGSRWSMHSYILTYSRLLQILSILLGLGGMRGAVTPGMPAVGGACIAIF